MVDSVKSMMMHGLANPKLTPYSLVEIYRLLEAPIVPIFYRDDGSSEIL